MLNTIVQLLGTLLGSVGSTVGETDLIYYMHEFENDNNLFYEQKVDESGDMSAIGIVKAEYMLEENVFELFQEIEYKNK